MTDAPTAIANLVYAYAERLDAGDFAGVGALFADATYRGTRPGGVATTTGAAAVQAQLERLVMTYGDPPTPRTKHVITNVAIDYDDAAGTATSRSYFTVWQALRDFPLQAIITGRYHDTFTRVDGRWRFTDRLIHSDLFGDLSRHLRVDPFGAER